MNLATNIMTLRNIRLAVAEYLLQANMPFIGDQVFVGRTEKAWPKEKCFLAIYVNQSTFDTQDTQPEIYKVTTDVVVDVVVQGSQVVDGETYELDDLFDIISSNVIDLLTSYPRPKWIVEEQVASSDFLLNSFVDELNGEGEIDKGTRKITFNATWYFEPITRDVELNDWLLMHTEIDFNAQPQYLVTNDHKRLVTSQGLYIRAKTSLAGEKYKSYEFESEMR